MNDNNPNPSSKEMPEKKTNEVPMPEEKTGDVPPIPMGKEEQGGGRDREGK